MIASLPMNDLSDREGAHDTWWRALAEALRAEGVEGVPDRRTRPMALAAHWQREDLLFSQICGRVVAAPPFEALTVVATPVYTTAFTTGPTYASAFVVSDDAPGDDLDAFLGGTVACNEVDSHSGHGVLVQKLAGERFARAIFTGAHVDSIAAVRSGAADLAAIDVVTWTLLAKVRPAALRGLRVLGCSEASLAPPFVTRTGDPDRLARLRAALDRLRSQEDLQRAVGIEGFAVTSDEDYGVHKTYAGEVSVR